MSLKVSLKKFSANEISSIKEYYDAQGYVVVENLLRHSKIQNLIKYYEEIKYSKFFIFFSQDTHLPIQPKLTPEGFIENSMLNPADLKIWKNFSQSIEE